MDNNLTRKDFLLKSSKAAVGITAIAGASGLITTAINAKTQITPWPWPYVELDPEAVRIQAHYLYWNGQDCCAGVFGATYAGTCYFNRRTVGKSTNGNNVIRSWWWCWLGNNLRCNQRCIGI